MRFLLGAIAASLGNSGTVVPPDVASNRTLMAASRTTSFSATGVTYLQPTGPWFPQATFESKVALKLQKAATLSNLRVYVPTNTRTAASSLRLRLNGNDTGLVVVIPAGVTGWFDCDGDSVRVAVGDLLSYKVLLDSGSGSVDISGAYLEHEAVDAATVYYTVNRTDQGTGSLSTSLAQYTSLVAGYTSQFVFGWESGVSGTPTETYLGSQGGLSHARILVTANTNNAETVLTLMKNGVATTLAITIPAGQSGDFIKDDVLVTVAPGDEFYWRLHSPSRTSGEVKLTSVQVMFTSSDGTWDLENRHIEQGQNGNAGTYLANFGGVYQPSTVAAEASRQIRFPFPAEISKFRGRGAYDTGGGSADFDIFLKINGSNTISKLTLTTGESSQNTLKIDAVNSFALAVDDAIGIGYTSPANFGGIYGAGATFTSGGGAAPATLATGVTTYNFTGAPVERLIPVGVSQIQVKLWGGGGGGGYRAGGAGGFTTAYIDVAEGDILKVVVGGGGTTQVQGITTWSDTTFPDGGAVRAGVGKAGAGGGSTRIYVNDVLQAVAGGGGGGCHSDSASGGGGGLVTTDLTNNVNGATQASGYGLLTGSPGSSTSTGANGSGGGGGGYYGGFTGTGPNPGSGGSAYISGSVVGVASTTIGANSVSTTATLPGGSGDAAYPGGNVGEGGAGNLSVSTPSSVGQPGYAWIDTAVTRVAGDVRLFQQHVEIVKQGPADVRLFQQHVEVVRSIS